MVNQLPYDASMMPTELERNISEVDRRIRAAELASGRATGAVSLLAVSKTKPSELIRQAHGFGLSTFGENYAQEMADKVAALADLPHVGSVAGRREGDRCRRTVAALETVLRRRETAFQRLGVESFAEYRSSPESADDPYGAVFLVIDGWGAVRQEFEALEALQP